MNTNLLHIVKQIIAANGEGILGDPARLKSLFSDLAKDEPKPLRMAFGRGLEAGAYTALKTAPDAAERALRKATIAQRLWDEHGLDPALCAEALDILEAALYGSAQAAYTPPPHQQPRPYQHQPVYQPSNYTAPPSTPFSQPASFQTSPGNPSPAPAAKNNTARNVLIAAAVLAAVVVIVVIARRVPLPDTELQNTAVSTAAALNSDAFEGFDPDKGITHYYFIPVTSAEALGVAIIMLLAGETNYINAWDTDSGVAKARNAGYNAEFGVTVYRANNQRDGRIIIAPAGVTAKKETY